MWRRAMQAHEFLQQAADALKQRAATRDQANGERSMALAVRIFNAAVGGSVGPQMEEGDGWLFQLCLKVARAQQGGFNADDYTDMAGYAALLGECAGREWRAQQALLEKMSARAADPLGR